MIGVVKRQSVSIVPAVDARPKHKQSSLHSKVIPHRFRGYVLSKLISDCEVTPT
jgi:hypothetical protein